jgi:predicted helicase
MLNEVVYLTPSLFPTEEAEALNMVICCTSHNQMPFSCLVTNCLPNEAVGGRNGQCFGLYHFSQDGLQYSDNITDWSLAEFKDHYSDSKITKTAVFHYIYAILHHPLYRDRFGQNLQRDLPHVPMTPDFWQCSNVGQKLVRLHLEYETAKRFDLQWLENPKEPLSYRVTGRMRLNQEAGSIEVNSSLTLAGIPLQAFDYKLGTRSALEWVVDQYRLEEDEGGNVTSDPNNPDNEQYIVQLIERVTTVSLETLDLIRQLPDKLEFLAPNAGRKTPLSL